MRKVFPQIVLWRALPGTSWVALLSYDSKQPFDPNVLIANSKIYSGTKDLSEESVKQAFLQLYSGNLTDAHTLFQGIPINSDDYPIIEYLSPLMRLEVIAEDAKWLTGSQLEDFVNQLFAATKPEQDPYLSLLPEADYQYLKASEASDQ